MYSNIVSPNVSQRKYIYSFYYYKNSTVLGSL